MRIIKLDIIRCVAIILLLIAHIGQEMHHPIGKGFGIPNFYYVSLGGVAVTIFLALSGCILELKYGNEDVNYWDFICKRCLRIYPVYYLSLLTGIAVYLRNSYHATGDWIANFHKLGPSDVVLSVTGGYAFAGKWGGPFVPTSWFISLIISMYFLFPYLSRKIKSRPYSMFCMLMFTSLISRLILGKFEIALMRPLDWFPMCRVFEFSLGIFIAFLASAKFVKSQVVSRWSSKILVFVSEVSFPMFLVHYQLLFRIAELAKKGINVFWSIFLYLVISFFVSWIVFICNNKIKKRFFGGGFDNLCICKN